jgi:predicted house-cleaning noncanonical NTP pyrophosphatase (MazG superfamily)
MDRLVIDRQAIRFEHENVDRLKGLIGDKAAGLVGIPDSWTPPFIILPTYAQTQWSADPKRLVDDLAVDPVLNGFFGSHSESFPSAIVRSSAVHETLDDRGLYESIRCEFTKPEVLRTVGTIWSKLSKFAEITDDSRPLRMALLIQPLIKQQLLGHLSNERRVSNRATVWVCEIESSTMEASQTHRFGIKRTTGPIDPLPRCKDKTELENCLRVVAACSSEARRIHYEWVWDGFRLWIVQTDFEEDYAGPLPCSAWTSPPSTDIAFEVKALVEEPSAKRDWRKIRCVRTFRACEIPTAKLFVLEDSDLIEEVADGKVSGALRNDLSWLCKSPIVIRTDVHESCGLAPEMLPRTNTIRSLEKAVEFLIENAAIFRKRGVRPEQYCFILHRFIPSKACAYSYSRPGFPRVRIDSTWGFPDGLFYYPHDSFEVDLERFDMVKRKIRGKYEFLDLTADGDWTPRKTGRPLDWKPSLSSPFLTDISRSSYKVSAYINMPIEMMFFVDIDPSSGHPACLPWFYNTDVVAKIDQSQSIRNKVATSFVLSSDKDLDSLDRLMQEGEYDDAQGPRALLVKLKPRAEFVRSQDFLNRCIGLIKGKSCIVELEGSILTHSYYLLARNRIPVTFVDPFEPKPRVRRFGKLVRDLIPVRIESHGEAAYTIRASPQELVNLLKAKAVEEAFELFWETRPDQMHSELADLLEVITSICEVTGRKFEELVTLAEKKRAERGGFQSGVILIGTREVPLIDRIAPGVGDDADDSIGHFSLVGGTATRAKAPGPLPYAGTREDDFQVRSAAKSFAFPLVPPNVSALNKIKQISVPGRSFIIELTYQEKRVLLTIRRKTKKEADTRQLMLF